MLFHRDFFTLGIIMKLLEQDHKSSQNGQIYLTTHTFDINID